MKTILALALLALLAGCATVPVEFDCETDTECEQMYGADE